MKRALWWAMVLGLAGVVLLPVGAVVGNDPLAGETRRAWRKAIVEKDNGLRVGQIFIIGNENTPQSIILHQLGMWPGKRVTGEDLRAAECRLARLGIFKTETEDTRPKITVHFDPSVEEGERKFVDLRVHVEERPVATVAGGFADGVQFLRVWNRDGFGVAVRNPGGVLGRLIWKYWWRKPAPFLP